MDYLSLCLICKDENDYLSEWLDYHILMGVDRFYIYDNESRVSLRETLNKYIERGLVVVLDIPGKAMQLYAYDHCLHTFGANTFWMGFIDADEFLVPKTTLDLKEFLKGYEQYGGLAVSSLFFGSNGHQSRPAEGQIASYTLRTDIYHGKNKLIKSIVRPGQALMPFSPHDFLYKENSWCVNERFLRVESRTFPNYIDKIQLNHYFCRSKSEIELKFKRGRGDTGTPWMRTRFEQVNHLANLQDTTICQRIDSLFNQVVKDHGDLMRELSHSGSILEKMSALAQIRISAPMVITLPIDLTFRAEIVAYLDPGAQLQAGLERGDWQEKKQLMLKKIQMFPQSTPAYLDLAIVYLNLNDPSNAWQTLGQAWQIAPNSYYVLTGMAFYFVRVKNFEMAEKTCHLLLEMVPHDLTALGLMTETMIGLERWDEALKIGAPVLELSSAIGGELPHEMGVYLVKAMTNHLVDKKDYFGAIHLWDGWLRYQTGDVNSLLELTRVLLLVGDQRRARQILGQAQAMTPQNEAVLTLLKQVGDISRPLSPIVCRQKKRH